MRSWIRRVTGTARVGDFPAWTKKTSSKFTHFGGATRDANLKKTACFIGHSLGIPPG